MLRTGLLAVAVGLTSGACSQRDVAPTPAQWIADPGIGAIRVDAGQARRGRIDREVTVLGTALPWCEANVRAEAGGRVIELFVDNGDRVEAGAPLVRIDASRQQLAVSGATARLDALEQDLEFARQDLERARALFGEQTLSRAQLETAELAAGRARSTLEAARFDLGSARRATRDTRIVAPIAGLVIRRSVDFGDTVGLGAPLLDLVDTTRIRFRFGLAGHEVGQLDEVAAAQVRVEDLGGEVFSGRFAAAAPISDPGTGLFDVEYHVDNPDLRIRAGMVATVALSLRGAEARVLIPRAALTRRGKLLVFELVAEPGLPAAGPGRETRIARERELRLGSHGVDEIEVLGGLDVPATVACSGQHALADGVLVDIEGPAATGASTP